MINSSVRGETTRADSSFDMLGVAVAEGLLASISSDTPTAFKVSKSTTTNAPVNMNALK